MLHGGRFFTGANAGGSQVGPTFTGTHTLPDAFETFDLSGQGYDTVRSFTFVARSRFDGSMTDNTELSEIQFEGFATPVTDVPTLGQWGLGALALLLAVAAIPFLRRH